MAGLMIALFLLSWLPYALIATFGVVGLDHFVTPYSAELPVMLAKASAIWNPIVYALKHPRYRSVLAGYLPSWMRAVCCRTRRSEVESKSNRSVVQVAKAVNLAERQRQAPIALQPMEHGVISEIPQESPQQIADDNGDGDVVTSL